MASRSNIHACSVTPCIRLGGVSQVHRHRAPLTHAGADDLSCSAIRHLLYYYSQYAASCIPSRHLLEWEEQDEVAELCVCVCVHAV